MSNVVYEPPIRHMPVSTNISNKTGMKIEKIHPQINLIYRDTFLYRQNKNFVNNAVLNFYTIIRSLFF